MRNTKLAFAADDLPLEVLIPLLGQIGGLCDVVKVNDLHDNEGPPVVRILKAAGAKKVWVDLKIKDIPKTAASRAAALSRHGADIITVHASGGIKMMEAAVKAVGSTTKVFAVTILTSFSIEEAGESYGKDDESVMEKVLRFALMAKKAGCHGIVCSAEEVGSLSKHPDLRGMEFATPGIRPDGSAVNDQKRIGTPHKAVTDGSTMLVVGRPIHQAKTPGIAAGEILGEIEAAEEKLAT